MMIKVGKTSKTKAIHDSFLILWIASPETLKLSENTLESKKVVPLKVLKTQYFFYIIYMKCSIIKDT
jgi:hypothetical protein